MNSAIVLVIDRLSADCLASYGVTWIETPHCDHLASRSLLVEHAQADGPECHAAYRGYWCGLPGCVQQREQSHLVEVAAQRGLHCALVTDEPALADSVLARPFADRVRVPISSRSVAADDVEQTQLARVFATAIDWLGGRRSPFLLWIHARGMEGDWDAPSEFRRRWADEEDPVPPDFVTPPCHLLPADYDPDQLLGVTQAYAGQVSLLDLCVGALWDALDSSGLAGSTGVILTSPRGFPLGQHGIVGPAKESLYAELLHVPLLLAWPEYGDMSVRTQAIVQPAQLCGSLLDGLGLLPPAAPTPSDSLLTLARGEGSLARFERAVSIAEGERAIRTPAWFLRRDECEEPALYVKPDDRWEVNEISARCREAVVQLDEARDEYLQAAQAGTLDQLGELPELLRCGFSS